MINTLLSLVAVTSFGLSPLNLQAMQEKIALPNKNLVSEIPPIYPQINIEELKAMLHAQAPDLHEAVINKVATALKCTSTYKVNRNNILSVIDYSLPSNQKRLWIFDLAQKKLLFNTYVSHGIKSGTLLTNNFSNKYNSKASSIGVYKTDKAYYGREGLSLRLNGLERNFNDNAMNRSIVMHGGWYLDEGFIKRYGRPGRSWGCPAVPLTLYQPIINTIKNESIIVVYYPSDEWFSKSKFLTCDKPKSATALSSISSPVGTEEHRDDVFFAQVSKGGEDKPILVMPATQYEKIFHAQAPLGRMLRRQIAKEEYIALNNQEINQIINNSQGIQALYFVIPTLRMVRGYYETEMKIVNLGTIKSINSTSDNNGKVKSYTVSFNGNSSVRVQSTDRFIRWLGL
ncbi:murein L,D-transpeptidase catalytic domain family protein [Legionella sp. km772]|uniref:murein L,D-transpeptidase catalytic domain family protein n=1 Tax=Legionella sp. km772 TaxID=2498111 RepID=UPI000F8E29C8|nr:murein L,D-transpeptidase catalytic domain family protein [Legionella sp. km772]RUR07962.1 murein L,D-transpeptidase catalytic domain family protein [Legionella sp. km772]